MPKITSPRQYGFVQAVAHGTARKATTMTPAQARAGLHELSHEKRAAFAREVGKHLRNRKR